MMNTIFLLKLLINLKSIAVLHHIYGTDVLNGLITVEPGGVSVQGPNDKDSKPFNLKEPLSH